MKSLLSLALLALTACSGRDIHPDVRPDTTVLVRQWTRTTPSDGEKGVELSSPAKYENTLLFGTRGFGVISLYPLQNSIRWVLPVEGGVISPLGVDRESVYFGGADGFLYSLSAETGRVQWRYKVRVASTSKPVVAGGRLFVTTIDDTVLALDAGSGQWLWQYRRRTSPAATIEGASAPLVDGREVIAGLSDGYLVSLSVEEGKLIWERQVQAPGKFTDVDASPVLEEETLYIPSYDGALYALKRKDGSVLWKIDLGSGRTPLIEGQTLYLPSSDGFVYAIHRQSTKTLWKFELDAGTPTSIVATDRYLIFGSSHQYLYVLDKNTGKPLYRWNAGYDSGFLSSPLVDAPSGRLYALSNAGNLHAFSIRGPRGRPTVRAVGDPYRFSLVKREGAGAL